MHTYMNEIRNPDGQLPSVAWPGCYGIVYLDRANNTLCPNCARESETEVAQGFRGDEQEPLAYFVHWEGEPLTCAECNELLEAEYGNPEDENNA